MNTFLRIASIAALVLTTFSACDNGSSVTNGAAESGQLHGIVYSMTDSTVIAGALVSLVDAVPYRVVSGPVATDDSGEYIFHDAPAGDWYLFVISGNHFMFNPANARISIVPGRPVERDVRMIRSELWGNGGAKFAGVVTDATTGQPIAGAFVSSMMFGIGYSFMGLPVNEAITDAQGRYEINATSWMLTDPVFQLAHPFGVTRDGYRPQFTTFFPIDNASTDTTYAVDVALAPNPFHGAIHGRVRYLNRDLEGVAVGLDYSTVDVNGIASKTASPRPTSLLGSAVRTDRYGRFSMGDLAPGTYYVDVAFLPDDGFMLAQNEEQWERILIELGENETVDLGTLQVVKTMQPVYPFNGAVIDTGKPTLRWTATPGADRYRLSAGTAHMLNTYAETSATSYQFELAIPPGTSVRWTVEAIRGECPDCERVSSFEAVATFTIAPR